MSIPGAGEPLLLSGAGGYRIERSLRFNSADSAYLSRTPASAGNQRTYTVSFWCKRASFSSNQGLFSTDNASFTVKFNNAEQLFVQILVGANNIGWNTAAVFRDPSAWYHVVVIVDTTQASSSNAVKVYVNGILQTLTFTAFSGSYTQNVNTGYNGTGAQSISRGFTGAVFEYANFYLADIYSIDGQALDPTSFAETNITTGQWVPRAYTGTYGTNGFRLAFADNSNNTATTLGKDTSGNGNNWTPNNLSVTAGAGNDSLVDTPTSYGTDTGAGGEVRGNYATLNPLISTGSNLSNGNLDYAATGGTYQSAYNTIAVRTGKWYFEGAVGTFFGDALIGVGRPPFNTATYVGGSATSWGYEGALGRIYNDTLFNAYGATFGAGDIIGVAFDADTGKLWFAKNGTWQASGNPATGANPAVTLTTGIDYFFGVSAGDSGTWTCNFGQRPFAYTAPSGFKALCDTNLPAPVVAKPNSVFDVKLYTGNGSTQTISGLGFSPDLVWVKQRNGSEWNILTDALRGDQKSLFTNATNAEDTGRGISLQSSGFSLDSWVGVNTNAGSYVAWTWDAGSSTATNTQGSITSQVRANASAGFSVVTATVAGGLSSPTIGHGLGVTPGLVIAKSRNETLGWYTWHQSLSANQYLQLNSTAAVATSSNVFGSISSSVITIGGSNTSSAWVSGASGNYVFYCFAPVAGYSSFGSYTGNGSTDGPFVYTGFRPAFVLVKMSSSTGNWTILDYQRKGYNVDNDPLLPNLSNSEGTTDLADITSNGFKLRTTDATFNTNVGTYVYAAWAQNPFQYARAR